MTKSINKILCLTSLISQFIATAASIGVILFLRYYFALGSNVAEKWITSISVLFLGSFFYGLYEFVSTIIILYTIICQVILGIKLSKSPDLPKTAWNWNFAVCISTGIFVLFSFWVIMLKWI